jgi:hypothetical protein
MITLIGVSLNVIRPVGVIIAQSGGNLTEFIPQFIFFVIVGGIIACRFTNCFFSLHS